MVRAASATRAKYSPSSLSERVSSQGPAAEASEHRRAAAVGKGRNEQRHHERHDGHPQGVDPDRADGIHGRREHPGDGGVGPDDQCADDQAKNEAEQRAEGGRLYRVRVGLELNDERRGRLGKLSS